MKKWLSKTENKWICIGGVIAAIGVVTPFLIMKLANTSFNLSSFEKLGTIGDFFGGTTVGLLSLASMIFVIAAIVMQKEELKLQREELGYTRAELERTREEHAMTNKTMKLQQFETTFFNMINLYNDVLKDIYHSGKQVKGREAIKAHYDSVNNYYYNQSVVLFVHEFMSSDKEDKDVRLRSFTEVVYHLIKEGYRTEQDFQTWINDNISSVDDFHTVIEETEHFRNLQIGQFDYDSLDRLLTVVPENLLIKSFDTDFAYIDSHKIEAFTAVLNEDDFMLSNYIKTVKVVINLIKDNDILTKEEKVKYIKIFVSQFSMIETKILHYYMNFGNDLELNELQEKYSIVTFENVYGDSIVI